MCNENKTENSPLRQPLLSKVGSGDDTAEAPIQDTMGPLAPFPTSQGKEEKEAANLRLDTASSEEMHDAKAEGKDVELRVESLGVAKESVSKDIETETAGASAGAGGGKPDEIIGRFASSDDAIKAIESAVDKSTKGRNIDTYKLSKDNIWHKAIWYCKLNSLNNDEQHELMRKLLNDTSELFTQDNFDSSGKVATISHILTHKLYGLIEAICYSKISLTASIQKIQEKIVKDPKLELIKVLAPKYGADLAGFINVSSDPALVIKYTEKLLEVISPFDNLSQSGHKYISIRHSISAVKDPTLKQSLMKTLVHASTTQAKLAEVKEYHVQLESDLNKVSDRDGLSEVKSKYQVSSNPILSEISKVLEYVNRHKEILDGADSFWSSLNNYDAGSESTKMTATMSVITGDGDDVGSLRSLGGYKDGRRDSTISKIEVKPGELEEASFDCAETGMTQSPPDIFVVGVAKDVDLAGASMPQTAEGLDPN